MAIHVCSTLQMFTFNVNAASTKITTCLRVDEALEPGRRPDWGVTEIWPEKRAKQRSERPEESRETHPELCQEFATANQMKVDNAKCCLDSASS